MAPRNCQIKQSRTTQVQLKDAKYIYFENISSFHNAFKERFIRFSNTEQLVYKSINAENYDKGYDGFISVYQEDVEQQFYPENC